MSSFSEIKLPPCPMEVDEVTIGRIPWKNDDGKDLSFTLSVLVSFINLTSRFLEIQVSIET